jgi:hypothetical protein
MVESMRTLPGSGRFSLAQVRKLRQANSYTKPSSASLSLICPMAASLALGCAHKYQRTENATRTEENRTTWQTAETAASQTQSVATEKKQGNRQTRRWTPDGKLMEEVIEQWGSDGRVQVDTSASASASATVADFSSVVASSSSSTKADTRAFELPWWLHVIGWVAGLVGAFLLVRSLRGWGRSHIPFL